MLKRLIRSSIHKARTKKVKLLSIVRTDGQRRGITMRKILISLYIRKGCSFREHLAYLKTDRAKLVEKSLARFFVQQTSQFSIHFEISWQLQRGWPGASSTSNVYSQDFSREVSQRKRKKRNGQESIGKRGEEKTRYVASEDGDVGMVGAGWLVKEID